VQTQDLITRKVSTDPLTPLDFFTPKVSSDPELKVTGIYYIYARVCRDLWLFFMQTLKFIQTMVFETSKKKLFILTNITKIY
jgi:hypothetical protein